jgi:PAS domain S-box-containing protein
LTRHGPGLGRFLLFAGILLTITASSLSVAVSMLYTAALQHQGARLQETAQSLARLIEEIGVRELRLSEAAHNVPGLDSPSEATLAQVRAAHDRFRGFGRTGEFVLARHEGGSIVYLVSRRHGESELPPPVDFAGRQDEPMRRALSGRSGTMIAPDYRGVRVVAAHEPVQAFGLGIVVKIDLAEVRAPYVWAGVVSGAVSLVLVMLGAVLFSGVTSPTLRRMAESEERYHTLFSNSPVGIYRTTPGGQILLANPTLVRMLGFESLAQLLERNLETEGFAPECPRIWFKERLEADGQVRGLDAIWLRRDGTRIPLKEHAQCVRDEAGRVRYYEGTVEDITDRKRAEEHERLARELIRKNAELEQLIYAASHDLRTPLVGVQGFVSELRISLDELMRVLQDPGIPPAVLRRVATVVKDDIPESLKFVESGVTRMSVLLSGLLRLARLDRAALVVEELDMNRIVGEVLTAAEYQAKQAGARFEVGRLPTCFGDAVLTGQVMANLIDNAIKYRDPARPLVVRVTGERAGVESVYCVADNGVGIAPGLRAKVFELFYQVAPSLSSGDGLGLTIVKRTADRLRGRVWIESEPGKGTRFLFAMPARRPEV